MALIQKKSYTRITLALDIIGKIDSGEFAGYHELGIIKHLISLYDTISIESCDEMKISCNLPTVPLDETNICWKVADILKKECSVKDNVSINIDKKIPVQGGLAGGSSNGANTMMLLNEHWNLGLSTSDLCELGRRAGMDVPFYFVSPTAFDSEIGNSLYKISTSVILDIVLLIPDFGVSTKYAYGGIDYSKIGKNVEKTKGMELALKNNSIKEIASFMHNDFELSVFKKYPKLGELKQQMIDGGCLGAVMSGSGSTLVGIANDAEDAYNICKKIGGNCITVQSIVK